MHPRRNLHTVIRSILNSMQFMLPIIARGLYLTASPAQAMPFNYLTSITPPPSKLTSHSFQITLISLWFPAQYRDTPRTNTPFSFNSTNPSACYTGHLPKGFLLFGFSWRSGFLICEKMEFSDADLKI